jgi:putative transposase
VQRLCEVLEVSRSGFYAWQGRRPSRRLVRDMAIMQAIRACHEESHGAYGSPRIHRELRRRYGVYCSRKRVARLMRQAGLRGAHPSKGPVGTTHRNPKRPLQPDLVRRNFHPVAPNRLWVADITQHPTDEGWLYVATVLDAFSRRLVGWSMSEHIRAELVVDAVNMAVRNRQPGQGLIHHSDHGSQYTSIAFTDKLTESGITGSMGTVGDALDNAMAESFNATLQTELLDTQRWRTRAQLKSAIFQYIEIFYNRRRLHSALGYLSPEDFERAYDARQADAG